MWFLVKVIKVHNGAAKYYAASINTVLTGPDYET